MVKFPSVGVGKPYSIMSLAMDRGLKCPKAWAFPKSILRFSFVYARKFFLSGKNSQWESSYSELIRIQNCLYLWDCQIRVDRHFIPGANFQGSTGSFLFVTALRKVPKRILLNEVV
jgi:hypothetical protein